MKIGNLLNLLNHGIEGGREVGRDGLVPVELNIIILIYYLHSTLSGEDLKEKLNNSQRRRNWRRRSL